MRVRTFGQAGLSDDLRPRQFGQNCPCPGPTQKETAMCFRAPRSTQCEKDQVVINVCCTLVIILAVVVMSWVVDKVNHICQG